MSDFPKPILGWSACLGLRPCRYDARIKPNPLGELFFSKVRLLDFCPEVEAGLGVPRAPMQLYRKESGSWALIEPVGGADFTPALQAACRSILARLAQAEGLLLKSKSPSCALFDCKGYDIQNPTVGRTRVAGLFGQRVKDEPGRWLYLDERQLENPWRRELWLTGLFQLARMRAADDFDRFHRSQQALHEGLGIWEALAAHRHDPAAYRDLWIRGLNDPPSWERFTRRLGLARYGRQRADLRRLAERFRDQSLKTPYPDELI